MAVDFRSTLARGPGEGAGTELVLGVYNNQTKVDWNPYLIFAQVDVAYTDTSVTLIEDAAVPADGKIVPLSCYVNKQGTTAWTTLTSLDIQDTEGTPVIVSAILAAALGNVALCRDALDYILNNVNPGPGASGTTPGKGLVVVQNGTAAGAGSTVTVTFVGMVVPA